MKVIERLRSRRSARLTTALTVPAGAAAAAVLGPAFTLWNAAWCLGSGDWVRAAASILNMPLDLLTNTLGWAGVLGFGPLYAGSEERPAAGWIAGSLVFKGGPAGHGVSRFAAGFTPTSTIFVSGMAWAAMDPDERSRLVNHELWHARHHFNRYTGVLYWPAYLIANVLDGIHMRNRFESGPYGAYTNVDRRWEEYRRSPEYAPAADPFWPRPLGLRGPGRGRGTDDPTMPGSL